MALIACPECRSKISSVAPQCPQCGFPLRRRSREDFPAPPQSRNSRWVLVGGLGAVLLAGGWIILAIALPFFQKVREANYYQNQADAPAKANISKERTYAYWSEVKELYFDTGLANASKTDIALIAASLRRLSVQIDELPTQEVDPEAVACGKALSELLLKTAAVLDKTAAFANDQTLVFQALVNLPAALAGGASDARAIKKEADGLRDEGNRIDTQIRRARTALSKRYGMDFPLLIPPVGVLLSPFLLTNGYYVVILNTSTSNSVSVTVTYTDAAGASRVQKTAVIHPGASEKLNPSAVGFTVAPGQKLTVATDGYTHTYNVDSLIP